MLVVALILVVALMYFGGGVDDDVGVDVGGGAEVGGGADILLHLLYRHCLYFATYTCLLRRAELTCAFFCFCFFACLLFLQRDLTFRVGGSAVPESLSSSFPLSQQTGNGGNNTTTSETIPRPRTPIAAGVVSSGAGEGGFTPKTNKAVFFF
jgi:hypothetical protein